MLTSFAALGDHVWEAGGLRVERLTWDDVHVRPVATVRALHRAMPVDAGDVPDMLAAR